MSKPPPESESAASYRPPAGRDPWVGFRRFTAARIALGRTGGSQPIGAVLDFRLAHARARDAVQAVFDARAVEQALTKAGITTLTLATAATDRRTFLLRPDLGRTLEETARETLRSLGAAQSRKPDLAVIVSDGLAAAAAERHAAPTLIPLLATLQAAGWVAAPVCVVPFARVKLQDEIGTLLGARFSLMLLGERPGLGVPDSLGAYFTAFPAPERTDADRNCVSNIRPEGLPPATAASKLAWLLQESSRTGASGVRLKDNQPSETSLPRQNRAVQ